MREPIGFSLYLGTVIGVITMYVLTLLNGNTFIILSLIIALFFGLAMIQRLIEKKFNKMWRRM